MRQESAPALPDGFFGAVFDENEQRISDVINGIDDATDPFSQAVRATRMPMVISNPRLPDNPVVFVNNAFCRVSGYEREEILGRNCRFLQGPETDAATIAIVREAVRAGRPVQVDIRNHRKNGEPFWNRLLLEPVLNKRGEIAYFFASQVDVTLELERLAGLEQDNAALTATLAGKLREQQDSEARFRFAAEAGGLGIWDLDLRSMQLTASPTYKEIFGFGRDTPFDLSDLLACTHAEDRGRVEEAIRAAQASGQNCDLEHRVLRADASLLWAHSRAQVTRTLDGAPHRLAGILLDVTARKNAEVRAAAQVQLNDKLRDIVDPSQLIHDTAQIVGTALNADSAGYGTFDLATGFFNPKFHWNRGDGDGTRAQSHVQRFVDYIGNARPGELVSVEDVETDGRTRHAAGEFRELGIRSFLIVPLASLAGPIGLIYFNSSVPKLWTAEEIAFVREVAERANLSVRDLTIRRNAEMKLHHLAHHDTLTGLPNRLLLTQKLEEAAHNPPNKSTVVTVLYLDLDRFKPVNDLFGHAVGDALLVAASTRLRSILRGKDTLARIGGDEFAIVLPETRQEDGTTLASRLLSVMAAPFPIDGQQIEVGLSIGVASTDSPGTTTDTLLRCADIAMYRVKDEGGGGYCIFEPSMNEELHSKRVIERDLRCALERNELSLHYQPIFSCKSGALEALEALLRWQHPTRGWIPPSEFIPAAEQSGLIVALGQWVLETACRAAASWTLPSKPLPSSPLPPLRVAINLSPLQFRQADFAEAVMAVLDKAGLDPSRLELEVTEGTLIENPDRAMKTFAALKRHNIRIALDDFGTGFSSLSYLQRFPFDTIKVDRVFVQGLAHETGARAIVKAVVTLAQNFKLAVVAEGVETEEQLAILKEFGCDRIQGYIASRPVPCAEVQPLLARFQHGHPVLRPGASPHKSSGAIESSYR
jgi:diguanylate cyclase (GGDEF)-like protein/PAS domain S-box-containing protein